MIRRVGAVAIGGAVGAVLRWWLGSLFPVTGGFPWTTFAINVSGSALLALLPALAVVRRRPLLPLLLGTGVLGGYTTLSSYAEQTRELAADGQVWTAAAYCLGSLVCCVGAVLVVQDLTHRVGLAEFEDEGGGE